MPFRNIDSIKSCINIYEFQGFIGWQIEAVKRYSPMTLRVNNMADVCISSIWLSLNLRFLIQNIFASYYERNLVEMLVIFWDDCHPASHTKALLNLE
jgi:hypothetical protein